MNQHAVDLVGLTAGAMTVAAFYCRDILRLRCAAICANLLFIGYGAAMSLFPILALHLLLLPLNVQRLLSEWRVLRRRRGTLAPAAPGAARALASGPRSSSRD